jgi:hypothetical protein
MSDKPWPKSLALLRDTLSTAEKARFFELFWPIWTGNGFATLTKRDTDLLVFHCLREAIDPLGKRSSHEWAHLLRITPSRYRSLRLESHLRFRHLRADAESKSDLERLLEQLGAVQAVELGGFADGSTLDTATISFVVEDPVIKMELEYRAKAIGGYVDFKRNREIVVLRLPDFLKILTAELGSSQGDDAAQGLIDAWVYQRSEEQEKALRDRIDSAAYAKMPEHKKLLSFIEEVMDLAGGGKTGPLVKMLKRIFKAQPEHKNIKRQKKNS